jgi:hypothetical protein
MPLPNITFLAPPGVTPGSTVQLHDGTTVVVSAAGTVTVSSLYVNDLDSAGFAPLLAISAKYAANATAGATVAAAGDLTGAAFCYALYSAVGAANLTTRTAALMIADGGLAIGQTYVVRIINSSAGITTVVGGTGVTITGTATLAVGSFRDFLVTVTGAASMTFQSVGTGTTS